MPNRRVSDDGSCRFTVTLPRGVADRLRALAEAHGSTLAAIMRKAASDYLDRYEAQQRKRAS